MAWPKAKPVLRGTPEIELALPKPIGVSKKFLLLDVAALPNAPHASGMTVVHVAWVVTFDNLGGDSSPDTRAIPSPKGRIEKRASSLKRMTEECTFLQPSVSGEFLRCAFTLLAAFQ
jgi:hypothetical protein